MAALLPFIAEILLIFLCYSKQHSWRDAILSATIAWGIFVVLTTEILSLFSLINFAFLCVNWSILNAVLLSMCLKYKIFYGISLNLPLNNYRKLNTLNQVLILSVIAIITTIGLIAIITPPNNWDTMAYVMPRVMHWIQNHNVHHYPTHYLAQLNNGPGAEFALLHLQILSGSDRLRDHL